MKRQQEMAAGLSGAPAGTQAAQQPGRMAQPVDEAKAKAIRTMRNDDLIRLHMTEAEREEYEKADDFNKVQIIRAKREELIKGTAAPAAAAPAPQQGTTVSDVHTAAKEAGVDIDTDAFKNKSNELTGESHLDNMTPEQLGVMKNYINEQQAKQNQGTQQAEKNGARKNRS